MSGKQEKATLEPFAMHDEDRAYSICGNAADNRSVKCDQLRTVGRSVWLATCTLSSELSEEHANKARLAAAKEVA
jgi:hypothetical protein